MNRTEFRQQLIVHEGLRSKPYVDTVGKITIGVGRNLTDKGLSPEEIAFLLDNDITACFEDLRGAFPWFTAIGTYRQHALLDLRFNLGPTGFRKFTTTLGYCARRDWIGAARAFRRNRKYFAQVGARADHIAHMLETNTAVPED